MVLGSDCGIPVGMLAQENIVHAGACVIWC